MPYATIDDVTNRYRPILSNIGTGDYEVASVEVASTFIAQAEGLVDAYLSERYTVPISPVPALITRITADIAICDMTVDKLPNQPDFMVRRCADAMEMLKKIQSGVLDLPGVTDATTTGGDEEIWSTTMNFHPVFSPVLPAAGEAPDIDRVEEDRDDRDESLPGGTLGRRFFGTPC